MRLMWLMPLAASAAVAAHAAHFATQGQDVSVFTAPVARMTVGQLAWTRPGQPGSFDSEEALEHDARRLASIVGATGVTRHFSSVGYTTGATTATFTHPSEDGQVRTQTLPLRAARIRQLRQRVHAVVERHHAAGHTRWAAPVTLEPLPPYR